MTKLFNLTTVERYIVSFLPQLPSLSSAMRYAKEYNLNYWHSVQSIFD